MKLFKKEEEIKFDEAPMHEFWDWFRDNQDSDYHTLAKKMDSQMEKMFKTGICHFSVSYNMERDVGVLYIETGDKNSERHTRKWSVRPAAMAQGDKNSERHSDRWAYVGMLYIGTGKIQEPYFNRLAELVPADIREKWMVEIF